MSHFNAHGIYEGSGSHVSSATTVPPSFVSVAARGEWSIGKILDVYFKFAMGGDQYLGRILALLDPNSEKFGVLPPHWKDKDNELVKRAIEITFGGVLAAHAGTNHDPTGLLSMLCASIIYHSDWLISKMSEYPDHPFHHIPILSETELLKELKSENLTIGPNDHVPMATGVPPHIVHTVAINKVFDICTDIKNEGRELKNCLRESVSDAVDAKVRAEGGVNLTILADALLTLKDELFGKIESIAYVQNNHLSQLEESGRTSVEPQVQIANCLSFLYNSKSWCIPKSFEFPSSVTRLNG